MSKYLLGNIIKIKVRPKILKLSIYIYLLGTIIGLSSIAVLTYMSRTNKILSHLLSSYSFPIIVLTAICIYGLFNYNNESIRIIDVIALELEKCSFGIYLIHIFVMRSILWEWSFLQNIGGPIQIILVTMLTFIGSLLITCLISYLPCAGYIIGFKQKK